MTHSKYSLQIGSGPPSSGMRVPHELTSPAALHLAELNLTRYDCAAARDALSLLHKRRCANTKRAQRPDDEIIDSCLFRDAIVRFLACVGDPAKGQLSADAYAQEPGGPTYLQWLKDLRDTYVAHAFGPLRQSVVSALPERGPNDDVIHLGIMAYQGPDTDALPMMVKFIDLGIAALDDRIKEASQEVIAQVNLMTPDAIRALPSASFQAAGNDQLRMSRRGFRAARAGESPQGRGSSRDRKS